MLRSLRSRTALTALAAATFFASVGTAGAGGNLSPIASATASPQEVVVGQATAFSSDASFDPDSGPGALTFAWDFGDGAQSTEANPSHVYASIGVLDVTLTVSDGLSQAAVTLRAVTLAPRTGTRPSSSGPLGLAGDNATLAVVNPDADTITFIDTASLAVREIDVCGDPRAIAWAPDDSRVYVTCFGSDEVWSISATDDAMLDAAATGRMPFGVVVSAATGDIFVANYGSASIDVFDPDLVGVTRIDVEPGPRALALSADGGTLYATHLLSTADRGQVTVVATEGFTVLRSIALVNDPGPDTPTSGRGVPNVLATIALDPAGETAWTGGIKANTGRGLFVDGQEVNPRNRVRGVFAPLDVATQRELVERRIDTSAADGVSGIAFSPQGRYAYLTHQGAARLSTYDVPVAALVDTGDGAEVPFVSRVDSGAAPGGVVVSADGSRAYVSNVLSRDISIYDLTDLGAPVLIDTVAVTSEPLGETIALGKRLFFSSRAPMLSEDNQIACASCHPDAGQDGQTWDFTQFGEGLRNTIDLRGRSGVGHGPVHWTSNFNEIQDFENDIQGGFGGEGLLGSGTPHPPLDPTPNAGRSVELDALAAYVSSLDAVPKSPYREPDGSLGEAAQRGLVLFFDDETLCDDCHRPPLFTDSTLTANPLAFNRHIVGTQSEGSGMAMGLPIVGFDTPTVLGVWATPPYLHDGSAETLRDVLTTANPEDRHGKTSHLSEGELDDLVAYMLALQGSTDEYPEEPTGETETAGSSTGPSTGPSTGTGSSGSGDSGTSIDDTGDAGHWSTSDGAGGSETDASGQGSDGGCGCTSHPDPPAWWCVVLLGLARRRRLQLRSPSPAALW